MIGVFLDDPDATPAAALRSKACSSADAGGGRPGEASTPTEGDDPARRSLCARLRYKGPYADGMKSAYRWLLGVWLPNSGYEAADAPIFEAYLNSPPETPPNDLVTDIHLPLEAAS